MNTKYLVFMGMGFELIGIILSSLYLGQIIDEHFGLSGLSMVGLSMAGLAGWIYHLVLLVNRVEANDPSVAKDEQSESSGDSTK